jgi:hypothetical protein
MISWMEHTLGFSRAVATELYRGQLLKSWKEFADVRDDDIDRVIAAIRRALKEESIAEIAVQRLKLVIYWVKYQVRTNRPFASRGEPTRYLSEVERNDFLPLREQKEMVDTWFDNNKEPDHSPLTLDVASAPKVFDKIKTILTRVRGAAGIPLAYVIRHQLEPPNGDDDPPYGKEDSIYPSYDKEMIARAPILKPGTWRDGQEEHLETSGPFAANFKGDNMKVWSILHAMLSTTGAWQHVKKFTAGQNGHQAWRTLQTHYFGTDKIDLMANAILTALKNLHYSGDRANFTFDKYCTAHVEQHNQHAALQEYGIKPLEERDKILHFQQGIKDPTFEPVRSSIIIGKAYGKFQDFDSVMTTYMTFKRAQTSLAPTSRVSAMSTKSDGRRGGAKRDDAEARKRGLPPQAEIDKCTHIVKKHYSKAEYKKFTPAEKARLWQLNNPGVTPGTGKKTSGKRSAESMDSKIAALTTAMTSAVSVISSLSNATTKMADSSASETPDNVGCEDASNRTNPALTSQGHVPKKNRTE